MDGAEFVTNSEEIFRDFNASYVISLRDSIARRAIPAKQDPLTSVLVRGFRLTSRKPPSDGLYVTPQLRHNGLPSLQNSTIGGRLSWVTKFATRVVESMGN